MKRWIFIFIGVLILCAVALYVFNPLGTASYDPRERLMGFGSYRIASGSMAPTLIAGDFIFSNSAAYRTEPPARGDVIVFLFPDDRSTVFVMRVIGLAQETLSMGSGTVFIDGEVLEEPYLSEEANATPYSRDFPAMRVPADTVFVLGDNRGNSRDSRFWGPLPLSDVIGQVTYIWMSTDAERIGDIR